jgi:hypothetical protein
MATLAQKPRWYVDLEGQPDFVGPGDFVPGDFVTDGGSMFISTVDSDAGTDPRYGLIAERLEVTQRQSDPIYRTLEPTRVSVSLQNLNGALTAVFGADPRGANLVVRRADEADGYLATRFMGQVSQPRLGDHLILEAEDLKVSVLQDEIPKGTVTNELFPDAPDLGKPLLVVFGNATNVPLWHIRDDRELNVNYYLAPRAAGGGSLTFNLLKSDGVGGQQFEEITPAEYTVLTSLPEYPGFTIVSFVKRQERHNSDELHLIYADISTPAIDRNSSRVRKNILTNTSWGLGQPVNAASFTAAETLVDPATTSLFADGIIGLNGPEPALDVLRLLGQFADQWLTMNEDGEWVEHVDTYTPDVELVLRDGVGDGVRNIVAIGEVTPRPTDQLIRAVSIEYRLGFDGTPLHTITRNVTLPSNFGSTHGRVLVLDGRFVTNHVTADKIAYRRMARINFTDRSVRVTCQQDARAIEYGHVVSLTYAPRGINGAICETFSVTDGLDEVVLDLWVGTQALYDAIYTYVAGPLPSESEIDPIVDFSNTAPSPPTLLSVLTEGAPLATDGTARPFVVLRYTTPSVNFSHSVVYYADLADSKIMASGNMLGAGVVDARLDGFTAGHTYVFRAESFNRFGLTSNPGGPIVFWLAPGDKDGPALPTGLALVDKKLTTAVLKWTPSPEKDVRGYNWQQHTGANGSGSLIASGFVEGATLPVQAGSAGYSSTHYRVQAVDFTGNTSGIVAGAGTPTWTASLAVTFGRAVGTDIDDLEITEPKLGPLAVTTGKRQPLLVEPHAYSLNPGEFTSTPKSHSLGVIPNITIDSGNPNVVCWATNITASGFNITLLNAAAGVRTGTAVFYFW